MLSLRILPRSVLSCVNIKLQNLHTTIRVNSSKNDSSSSSSSDSDSDTEKTKNVSNVKKDFNPSNVNDNLNNLLSQMVKEKKSSKSIRIGKARQSLIPKLKKDAKENRGGLNFNKEFEKAAEDVATTLGEDVKKTKNDLLYPSQANLSSTNTETKTVEKEVKKAPLDDIPNSPVDLMDLLRKMDIKQETAQIDPIEEARAARAKKYTRVEDGKSIKQPRTRKKFDLYGKVDVGIFGKENSWKESEELGTWEILQQREIKAALIQPPINYFEEMIQWTEKGMLWHFPINNEQGMTSEDNVHFSEHVFMEKHLQGWCPKKGPIRHFMELVCVGLSKNAFLTVEEKKEHIMWYKNYFASKESILREIGALPEGHSFGQITAGKNISTQNM